MSSEVKKIKWYQKKEIYGVLALGGLVLTQLPEHTTAFKIGVVLNGVIGIGLTWFGVRDGYKHDNLPSGLSKVMDKIPNSITGTKGSEETRLKQ